MKSKVNPRLLIVAGIALVLLAGFGAITVLRGGEDSSADSGSAADSAGSEATAGSPGEPASEPASADADPPADGTPIVADEGEGSSDWAVQANLICGRLASDVLAQGTASTPEAAADALEQARQVVEEIGALTPAPGTENDAAEFVALLQASVDAVDELISASEEANLEDFSAFIEEQAVAQARLEELALTLGADTCLSGSASSGDGDAVTGEEVVDADEGAGGLLELQDALENNDSVVLVVYSPKAELDTRVVREARAGANGGGAGFVAVNGTRESQIKLLAETFDVRETPATLVVDRDLVVSSRFSGFADRETVAQAVKDSLGAS